MLSSNHKIIPHRFLKYRDYDIIQWILSYQIIFPLQYSYWFANYFGSAFIFFCIYEGKE